VMTGMGLLEAGCSEMEEINCGGCLLPYSFFPEEAEEEEEDKEDAA